MSPPRNSIFRVACQVPPELIAAMSEADLNVLMAQLLKAQAYKCGSPPHEIRVNTEGKAKDDGCDGWSAKPAIPDAWLGSTATCWQFKQGGAGTPAKLSGEVTKRIPRETLTNGGRFVVVASSSTNGRKGEEDRLDTVKADAIAAQLPTGWIEIIGSERLANWCNEHPAVAARWVGRPEGLLTLDDWSNLEVHQVPWQATEEVRAEIASLRADLDFVNGAVYHLHIQGLPGVGKSRFALELCRNAEWSSTVIYVSQATDLRLNELIDSAAADPGVRIAVVADEVQVEQLIPLRDSIGRGRGRIRLITIGHCSTPDPDRIPSLFVKPLDHQTMRGVVKGWYAAMPPEHVNFVVRFADGFVRLAKLAAYAVDRNPTMDVRGLLGRNEIRGFLDNMLGAGDRRPLYVVSALSSVGWTDDKEEEGMAIAAHFSLDWGWVRATVDEFNRHFGIAPRGGRYRYISPTPLGIHLAVEAWTSFPREMRSLPDVLPSEEAKEAYYRRLSSIAGNPEARDFAREELAFFFRFDDFLDPRSVRRWSALSFADPCMAARNILHALSSMDVESRRRIRGEARRASVWALVRLAWGSSSFHDAVLALALLAEAENERWSNNASGEFVARFQNLPGRHFCLVPGPPTCFRSDAV